MTLLIFGLLLFIATHLIPTFPKLRTTLIDKTSSSAYIGMLSVFALVSVASIVLGLKQAPFEALYDPPSWGRYLNMMTMFVALYFFASNTKGTAPSSVTVLTAFPISWGVLVWATGHLFANGDLAHVIFFGGFLIYNVISIITGKAWGLKPVATEHPPFHLQVIFVVVIIIVYSMVFLAHDYFTGMPLI